MYLLLNSFIKTKCLILEEDKRNSVTCSALRGSKWFKGCVAVISLPSFGRWRREEWSCSKPFRFRISIHHCNRFPRKWSRDWRRSGCRKREGYHGVSLETVWWGRSYLINLLDTSLNNTGICQTLTRYQCVNFWTTNRWLKINRQSREYDFDDQSDSKHGICWKSSYTLT